MLANEGEVPWPLLYGFPSLSKEGDLSNRCNQRNEIAKEIVDDYHNFE